jgi:hypothetical protein
VSPEPEPDVLGAYLETGCKMDAGAWQAPARYLTAKEVAVIRRKSESGLCKERDRGEGPPWLKDGTRILYPAAELYEYLEGLTVTPATHG